MFALQILSPEGIVYNDTVDELILPTANGEIAVLSHHIPLYSKLTEGTITVKKGAKETVIAILGGFLEVRKETVTVLSDYAIEASSIQVARAEAAKKQAEEMMKNKKSETDFTIAEKELKKSILELKVAQNLKKHHS